MRVIAVSNQKGGVGKTTTAVNVAASMASQGQRVLLLDCDAQGNASGGAGLDKSTLAHTTKEWMLGECCFDDVVCSTPWGFDVIPTDGRLAAAEMALVDMPDRQNQLAQALAQIEQPYDRVIIDCPPSLSLLTVNAWVAAQGLLIPVQCEYYALEGISSLMSSLAMIQKQANPDLGVLGIVRTLYDGRNRLTEEVSQQLIIHFGGRVCRTVIPRNVRLAEAPSHGQPITQYDPRSAGAQAYNCLATELLEKAKQYQTEVAYG